MQMMMSWASMAKVIEKWAKASVPVYVFQLLKYGMIVYSRKLMEENKMPMFEK